MENEVKNGKYKDKYGNIRWYKDGKYHREDGPAIIEKDGSKAWYLNGNLNREDGPAIELASGSKYWYLDGKLHREDSPAIEYASGKKEWWVNGVEYTEEEFNQWLEKKLLNENLLATLEEKPSVKKVKI